MSEHQPGIAGVAARLARELGAAQVELDEGSGVLWVRPRDLEETALTVRLAAAERLPVGIGESVIALSGGGALPAGRLHIETSRLSALVDLDESSLLVRAQAGMRFDALASRLAAAGMALAPLPPASLPRTLGALLAAPRPSEAGPRGRFIDLCAAADAVLPDGTPIATRLAPRKATGPDFLHALLGARGTTGIIAAAWLRAARRPPRRGFAAFGFADGHGALLSARILHDRGARPADLAVVDQPVEGLAVSEVLLALHFDGTPEMVAAEAALATAIVQMHHGRVLPPPIAEDWFFHPSDLMQLHHEVFVPMAALPGRWADRPRPAILRGFRPAGAALCSTGTSFLPAPSDRSGIDELRAALAQKLDPDGRFRGARAPRTRG